MVLVFSLSACGRRGLPEPQDQQASFALNTVQMALNEQGVFTIVATLTGAVKNVRAFTLELEPIMDNSCVDCPFVPDKRIVLQPDTRITNEDGASYTFSYQTSSSAPLFRWRFGAQNVHSGFPYALTPLETVSRVGAASHILPVK